MTKLTSKDEVDKAEKNYRLWLKEQLLINENDDGADCA
jgi:hypothetical protein